MKRRFESVAHQILFRWADEPVRKQAYKGGWGHIASAGWALRACPAASAARSATITMASLVPMVAENFLLFMTLSSFSHALSEAFV